MNKFFNLKRSETFMLFEAVIHCKRFRRLKIRDKQLEAILNHLKKHDYMVLNQLDKSILLAALKHWSFKQRVIMEPKTKYIARKVYKALVEKFEEAVKR